MSQLILIDKISGLEIGRRDMLASERYQLYHDHMEHELLCFENKLYVTHTAAWRIPEEDFVASVTYHAQERMACGCTLGYCTCC